MLVGSIPRNLGQIATVAEEGDESVCATAQSPFIATRVGEGGIVFGSGGGGGGGGGGEGTASKVPV